MSTGLCQRSAMVVYLEIPLTLWNSLEDVLLAFHLEKLQPQLGLARETSPMFSQEPQMALSCQQANENGRDPRPLEPHKCLLNEHCTWLSK